MRTVCLLVLCAAAGACGREPAEARTVAPAAAATPPTIPHGDHNPHFGGIVLMNGDLHFEVVIRRSGECRVYFSDAIRNELPAATAADVTVTITQQNQSPEAIHLRIDDAGESWVGHGARVADPSATARIAYSVRGDPYFIDVPVPR